MAALPESRGALHLKHSILLAKLCSLHPDLRTNNVLFRERWAREDAYSV